MYSIIENGVLQKFDVRDLDEHGAFTIPDNVEEVGECAFLSCKALKSIKFGKNVRRVGEHAFAGCFGLQDVEFNDRLAFIKKDAFKNCDSLTQIELPQGMMILQEEVFLNCRNLRSIKLPNSLTKIGDKCFFLCEKLEEINLPNRLVGIGCGAFGFCIALKNVEFGNKIKYIHERAFENTLVEHIVLPDGLNNLGIGVFYGCQKLKDIKFPKELKKIPDEICTGCDSLESVEYPSNIEEIGNLAFFRTAISDGVLPDTIKYVGEKAYGRTQIGELVLPSQINTLGRWAFSGIPLNKVEFPKGMDKFASNVFEGTNPSIIVVNKDFEKKEYKFSHLQDVLSSLKDKGFSSLEEFEQIEAKIKTRVPMVFLEMLNDGQRQTFINTRFKPFNNYIKYLLMDGKKIYDDYNKSNLIALLKFAYNLGAFSLDPNIANRASVFLRDEFSKMVKVTDYNYFFGDMLVLDYNPAFVEFFYNNAKAILEYNREHLGFLSKIHKDFDLIQSRHTSNRGKQRQLAPTMEFFVNYFRENKFEGIDYSNQQIADELGKFFYKQSTFDFALEIFERYKKEGTQIILDAPLKEFRTIPLEMARLKYLNLASKVGEDLSVITQRQYTYDWLKKDNPENFTMGKYCDCCAHLEGVGRYIVYASIIRPDMRNVVIRDVNNQIIAKSTMYVNVEEGYAVCNNFEISSRARRENKKEIVNAFLRGIDDYARVYNANHPDNPIRQINVGRGFNDATQELLNISKPNMPLDLEGIHFSDYNPQPQNSYDGDWFYGQICVWKMDEDVEFLE